MNYEEVYENHIKAQMASGITSRSRQIREAITWIYEAGEIPAIMVNTAMLAVYDIEKKYPVPDRDIWILGKRELNNLVMDDDILKFTHDIDGEDRTLAIPTAVVESLGVWSEYEVDIPPCSVADLDVFSRKYASGKAAKESHEAAKKPKARPQFKLVK